MLIELQEVITVVIVGIRVISRVQVGQGVALTTDRFSRHPC